jgi:uncharacterized delta-60 repeat protein
MTALFGAAAVAIQSDGKIITVGTALDPVGALFDFALARYNTDGSPDTNFGTGGKVLTRVSEGGRTASGTFGLAVAIQLDGKIVAAGQSSNGVNSDFALVRYNSDGSLDTGFGTGGKVTTHFGGLLDFDAASAVAIQSDGKIVAAGGTAGGAAVLVRYTMDGSLDVGFGTAGKVIAPIAMANAVAIQSDGKIVAAEVAALVRYNSDGSLDVGFGTGGTVTISSGGANAVALQADGKIVAVGHSNCGFGCGDFTLVRYNSDGSLDAGFGSGGAVTTSISPEDDGGNAVALQADGKIVVAGQSGNSVDFNFALARYDTDGSLDSGFGTGGKVITPAGSGAGSLVIQSDGKLVAAGGAALVRYWP